MAESFKIIAVNFSKMIKIIEEDIKEDQAFRKVANRLLIFLGVVIELV